MTWARLDDAFADHPKVASLSDAAFRLHVSAICYSARFLTDGELPRAVCPRLGGCPETASELVDAGLWETTDAGWAIHDYLDFNPSKAAVDDGRRRKQAAGQAGGQASAQASAQARATAEPLAFPKQYPVPVPVPVPVPISVPSPDPLPGPVPATAPAAKAATRRAKPEFIELTAAEREKLIADYADIPEVRDKIALALQHPAHLKYPTGQYLYVKNWLSQERERRPSNGRYRQPATNGGKPDSFMDELRKIPGKVLS